MLLSKQAINYLIMRNINNFFLPGIIGLTLVSCVENKDLHVPGEETSVEEPGLIADFLLKSEKSISVTAVDGNGDAQEGVKIGIFTKQPYTSEGSMNISPVFVGYTDASGTLNAEAVVANNVSDIYVVPLTAGYGTMQKAKIQNSISLNFNSVPFPQAAVSRASMDEISQNFELISGLYQLYIPYGNMDVDKNGIPIQGGSPLVSKEQLSPALVNKIDSWYPEKQNVQVADLSKNSDLVIVDTGGARVWVTYVGDGGFYVSNQDVYNSLMYYNYKDGDLTSHEDVDRLRMTMLLPNTNQLQCPSGLKVQLLYWDGMKYDDVFPEGTRIGFAVARSGFKKDGTDITDKTAYSFKNKLYPTVNGDVSGMYYSTPILNAWGKSQAVTRELDGYNCCVTGFDIRPFGDRQSDYDFNDVMLKVTATPADLDLAKVTVTNPSEALEVSPVNENGEFTVTVKQGSASKASYALMVQAPTGKAAKLTVKTLAAGQKVTMSLKAAGSIDLTFPEKGVALQPKYRNYAGELENVVYTLALKQGKVTLDAAFDDYLTIGEDGLIRWNGTGSLESGNVCLITMTGELPNGTMLFATAQVRVTQTPVILRLSKASLSLNKRLEEKTQVTVTTSTRGYTLGDVELLVTDNKNVPSDGLTAAYENGLLTLSVNEKTVYGGSYKVQLWVTPKRVTTLMVRIPAEKNSAVTMTARARGGIDVIRDASEVVVTPIYRNCLDGASLKKQVKVTWAQDGRNYSQDVTEDFILTWAQDGTLHVSKVPGKELALTGKYRLEILCEGMEKEAYTALSVKCGTARFTVASVSLYAKDANDMARLTITTTDKTVNTLERVELKDARLKGTYEVLDLGGGQFALCLIPGAKAKTGTVTLNLFCEGNTTAKPSGTVSVKVEIR